MATGVSGLGKQAVSERRYTEAEIARRQAMAKVLAYGMTLDEINRLLASGNAVLATGEFDLLAPQQGTILSDNFVVGELIEPWPCAVQNQRRIDVVGRSQHGSERPDRV